MEKLFDLEAQELNMGDALTEHLKKQNLEDLAKIHEKYSGGELEDKKDQVAYDLDFNLEKLDFVRELPGRDEKIQRKFNEMALYIDSYDINKGNKIDAILTFGVAISKIPMHVELLDNESAYILSTALIGLPLGDYESYGSVLANPSLLEYIKLKSSDMNDRRAMVYGMMDYCDNNVDEYMTEQQYKSAVGDCMKIVNDYIIDETTKKR